MITIIRSAPYRTSRSLHIVNPNVYIKPGQFAQLDQGQTLWASDGSAPFGIIENINHYSSSSGVYRTANVWHEYLHFLTDQFELNVSYSKNSVLYCSNHGKCTTIQGTSLYILGTIMAPPANGLLEIEFDPTYVRHLLRWNHGVVRLNSASGQNNLINKQPSTTRPGMSCSCGEHNEYIDTGNQPDGSYKCYRCRNNTAYSFLQQI